MSGPDRQQDTSKAAASLSKPPTAQAQSSSEDKRVAIDLNDNYWGRTKNVFNYYTGRFDKATKTELEDNHGWIYDKSNCDSCISNRDWALAYSPTVRFLQDKVKLLGGDLNKKNITCMTCSDKKLGGFDPDYGIQICSNYALDSKTVEDVISHEMIHAYDHLRFKLDWNNNLKHAACTEIRASSLSGECRWAKEFFGQGFMKLSKHHQACVRRRAELSVMARSFCKDRRMAAKAVNDVWDSCFADTRPFDEIYR